MRITDQSRTDLLIRSLNVRSSNLSELYEKLATQREVIRPSDDPVRSDSIMRINSQISAYQQDLQSMQYAQTFMLSVSDVIESVSESLTRAKVLALNAVNGTLSQDSREAIANEVNELIETIIADANQNFEQRYVLSGARTDTPPLAVTRNADGDAIAVAYQGGADPLSLPVSDTRSISVGLTAQSAVIDTDALDSLISLRDHLRNTAGLTEQEQDTALRDDLGRVNQASQRALREGGKAGARAATLDLMIAQTENSISRAQEILSELRDPDVAAIAVEMQKEQTLYQSLLTAAGQIQRMSLMDYL